MTNIIVNCEGCKNDMSACGKTKPQDMTCAEEIAIILIDIFELLLNQGAVEWDHTSNIHKRRQDISRI